VNQSKDVIVKDAIVKIERSLLKETLIADFSTFAEAFLKYFAQSQWHWSVDVGVNGFFDSYTDTYNNSKPSMSYMLFKVDQVNILLRETNLKELSQVISTNQFVNDIYDHRSLNKPIDSTINNLFVIHKDVKIFEIKMSSEMVIEVVSHSVEQLVKHNYTISSVMARDISAHLSELYNGSWLVKISNGNISSSFKGIHKDPCIKFAFKSDIFEIEKEVSMMFA